MSRQHLFIPGFLPSCIPEFHHLGSFPGIVAIRGMSSIYPLVVGSSKSSRRAEISKKKKAADKAGMRSTRTSVLIRVIRG